MSETMCEICGVYDDQHDYEHLARTCLPMKIGTMTAWLADARAVLVAIEHIGSFGVYDPADVLKNVKKIAKKKADEIDQQIGPLK